MKTAREVAWRFLAESGLVFIPDDYDRLAAAIEQVQRETVEALLVALEGYYCAPVDAELEAYLREALAVPAPAPPSEPRNTCECKTYAAVCEIP